MKRWNPDHLQRLIDVLKARSWRVLGPRVRDGAMVYDDIDQLTVGWGDEQDRGRYRLVERGDQSRFGFNLGPDSWKRFLFPAEETLFRFRDGELISERQAPTKQALFGVRACELAAIQVQDKVFLGESIDPGYQQRRENLFLVAVNCSQAAATCFCQSTGDGPQVGEGADLVITEVNPEQPFYLVSAHSDEATVLLEEIGGNEAGTEDLREGELAIDQARQQLTRSLPAGALGEALLEQLNHSHWEDVAERCLACGNCTQVCPTCFCSTSQERVDPVSLEVSHVRLWDSCFTEGHSYVSGGVVHQSVKSRYRQWLTHKLGSWKLQFDVSGCTGCGRCISWCPVGIDLTAEIEQLRGVP